MTCWSLSVRFFCFFKFWRIFFGFLRVVVQEKNETQFLKEILADMPALNFKVLNFLLKFFKKVNQYEEKNLMTPKNIAICITPCILRSLENTQQKSSADLHKEIAKSFILVNCVRKMIENYEELFNNKEEEEAKMRLENCLRRKTLVIQEMKQYAKNEEEKLTVSAKQN